MIICKLTHIYLAEFYEKPRKRLASLVTNQPECLNMNVPHSSLFVKLIRIEQWLSMHQKSKEPSCTLISHASHNQRRKEGTKHKNPKPACLHFQLGSRVVFFSYKSWKLLQLKQNLYYWIPHFLSFTTTINPEEKGRRKSLKPSHQNHPVLAPNHPVNVALR